jgi:hypothetical protein
MGDECICTMRLGGKTFGGRAHLDLEKLLFRGDEKRLAIPLAAIKSTTLKNGVLEIDCPEGLAVFDLGALAQKWAQKILHPKSLIDKLGVKPDSRVCVVNVTGEIFWQQLRQRVNEVAEKPRRGDYDLIFFGVETKSELTALASLRKRLKKTGAIWVVRPKGKGLSDVEVIAAAKSVGLVDVKVASFSATHSAEKLMIPLSAR